MRTYSKVAVAVAAVIGTGSAFAATNPAFTLSLNIAGSSAMRDATIAEFQNVLCGSNFAGPFVSAQGTPTASGGENPDFRALTCTLGANAGSALNGTVVAVYYRSEGGSIFGLLGNPFLTTSVSSLPNGVLVNRLNIGTASSTQPANFNVFETVPQLLADTQTGAVVQDNVDLGVSDVEPTALIGENSGSEYTFFHTQSGLAFPTPAILQNLPNFGAVVGEVYAPIVSNTAGGGTAGFASATGFSASGLTSQEIATISVVVRPIGALSPPPRLWAALAPSPSAVATPVRALRRSPRRISWARTVALAVFRSRPRPRRA